MSNDEIEMLMKTCKAYETKLIELMGEDAFHAFGIEIAKELFADEICHMADGDFKEEILDNFDAITGSDADYQELMGNIKPQAYPNGDCENCAHCIPAGAVSFCELPQCDFEALGGDGNERLSGNC